MALQQLGTILPTRESLDAADRFADQEAQDRRNFGHCLYARFLNRVGQFRIVGGEDRWYLREETGKSSAMYGIVGRDGKGRLFTERTEPDGARSSKFYGYA